MARRLCGEDHGAVGRWGSLTAIVHLVRTGHVDLAGAGAVRRTVRRAAADREGRYAERYRLRSAAYR